MAESNGQRYVTFKWLIGFLLSVLAILGAVRGELRSDIDKKADKEIVTNMSGKIDRIYDCFLQKGLIEPEEVKR